MRYLPFLLLAISVYAPMTESTENSESKAAVFVSVDVPGATSTIAENVNGFSNVVGSYVDSAGRTHGFLLKNSQYLTLDFPGAAATKSYSINDGGLIIGTYFQGGVPQAFRFNKGTFQVLNVGSGSNYAFGLNRTGSIVGA